jgi:acyl carrier protein
VTTRVRAVWSRLLRCRVEPDDDFFALGGDSLAAVRLIHLIERELDIAVPVQALFEAPTARGFAARVEAAAQTPVAGPSAGGREATSGPLSFVQEWLLQTELVAPGNSAVLTRLDLIGTLDLEALMQALCGVVQRHDILRTVYATRPGGAVQVTAPLAELACEEHDLTGLAPDAAERELERVTRELAARPFDLGRDPGMRVLIAHRTPRRMAVVIATHHIAFDGWSRDVLVGELARLYRCAAARQPPPPRPRGMRYAEYAAWQRERFSATAAAGHLAYWRETIAPRALPLAAAASPTAARGTAVAPVAIDDAVARRFKALAAAGGASLFMACLAAFGAVLGRRTGAERFAIATLAANRTWAATRDVIGSFASVVPLAVDLRGDPPFGELLARAKKAAVEGMRHQEYPFEHALLTQDEAQVRELLAGLRVGIALHPPRQAERDLGGVRLVDARGAAKRTDAVEDDPSMFDATLELRELGSGVGGQLRHDLGALSREDAAELVRDFVELVRVVGVDADRRLSRLPGG